LKELNFGTALDALSTAASLSRQNGKALALRGYLHARAGRLKDARDVLTALETSSPTTYAPPYAMALVSAGLNDADATFLARARIRRAGYPPDLPDGRPEVGPLSRGPAGSLPAVTLTSMSQAIDRLLYERRYSLFFEGGHRWIDMRRYGRLADLPRDLTTHTVAARYPIPLEETTAGGG
jgi:peptidoglycan/xylan/chitin deacetylase (PgdA/CDA1 family)